MSPYLKRYASLILSILLGIVSGFFLNDLLLNVALIVSEIFINLLKLISLPIIFLSITSTISGMTGLHEMKSIGKKVIYYTIVTTLTAAAIALTLFKLINPVIFPIDSGNITDSIPSNQPNYLSFVIKIIPSNPINAFVENNVIGVAFMAMLLGLAILNLPIHNKKNLNELFTSLFAAMLKITSFIIKLMPIGIWAFTTLLMKDFLNDSGQSKKLIDYLICIVGANLIQGFIYLPLLLKWNGISPIKAFRGVFEALITAFFSKSSNATLPITLQCIENHLGVSKRVANFTLPLCSVINMNGCAAFILTTVLFISMSHGYTFSFIEQIGWIFLATIAAIGNAGVPMGCYFLTTAFVIGMDLPLYLLGLILPFYTLLDMLETGINVWSDSCVTLIVDKQIKEAEVPEKKTT